ncbi:hypothetical protein CPAR01_15228 [Colletotrichum paranaense]|uniref:Uncharacterized protein n=2 Tax=Colletotrichum acutatum species complex TaxID=2707335 RepID=A0AAI9XTU2_9PEZI|nr:uncharacterized protein CPAR01_15228 [Colletotrichum paranaense]KAK1462788.1 hypothetical protein CMEL01_13899 [Colletotrichum melonis]KAK1520177.1 hypothetical protein CPAR01_15228 [Colletotrichum paranaense]
MTKPLCKCHPTLDKSATNIKSIFHTLIFLAPHIFHWYRFFILFLSSVVSIKLGKADIFASISGTSGCSDESDSLSDGATFTGPGPVRVGLLLNQIPSSSRTAASSFPGPVEVQLCVVVLWLVWLAHRRVFWA